MAITAIGLLAAVRVTKVIPGCFIIIKSIGVNLARVAGFGAALVDWS